MTNYGLNSLNYLENRGLLSSYASGFKGVAVQWNSFCLESDSRKALINKVVIAVLFNTEKGYTMERKLN